MSSASLQSAEKSADIFYHSFGMVPDVSVRISCRTPLDALPNMEEQKLWFQMLDVLTKDVPFDQWEH